MVLTGLKKILKMENTLSDQMYCVLCVYAGLCVLISRPKITPNQHLCFCSFCTQDPIPPPVLVVQVCLSSFRSILELNMNTSGFERVAI